MASASRTASEIVRDVMERDAVVRSGLARGLINVRALARHLQVVSRENTTFEALVAAIRRYPIEEKVAKDTGMGMFITKVGMKDRIVEATIRNEPDIPALLGKFSEEVDYSRGETLSIVSGAKNVRVVIDSKNLERLKAIIPKRNVLDVVHDLAAVMVNYDEAAIMTQGVLAALCTEIAINNVNIHDFVQSVPDVTFVVAEKDAVRTYQAIKRLSSKS